MTCSHPKLRAQAHGGMADSIFCPECGARWAVPGGFELNVERGKNHVDMPRTFPDPNRKKGPSPEARKQGGRKGWETRRRNLQIRARRKREREWHAKLGCVHPWPHGGDCTTRIS